MIYFDDSIYVITIFYPHISNKIFYFQLSQLQAASVNDRKDELKKSNELLRQEVQCLKRKLIDLETKNGIKQVRFTDLYCQVFIIFLAVNFFIY